MAIRKILTNNDPVLLTKCREIVDFDARLHELLDDMAQTMRKADGVGLAANQVGVLRRVCVIDVEDDDGLIELINPEIVACEGEQREQEGCLSYPGEFGTTKRPLTVEVKAFDRFGKPFTIKATALKARALCHEIDHLDGVVFKSHVINGTNI